jgi:hypothetical protein
VLELSTIRKYDSETLLLSRIGGVPAFPSLDDNEQVRRQKADVVCERLNPFYFLGVGQEAMRPSNQ